MAKESARISPSLYATYIGYKKATGKVLKWLATNSHASARKGENASSTTWTIDRIKRASQEIVRRKAILPLEIRYAFEDAIKMRKEITRAYKVLLDSEDDKTARHEFFTKTYV